MSVKSISGILAWTGIAYSLFSLLAGMEKGYFTPCDGVWLIAIVFTGGLLLSITGVSWLKPWLSLILTLTGTALLLPDLPFLIPGSLFLTTAGFNPVQRIRPEIRVIGILSALILVWLKRSISWDTEVDAAILAAISLSWFLSRKRGPQSGVTKTYTESTVVKAPRPEKIIGVLIDSFGILVIAGWAPLENRYIFLGMIVGLLVFLLLSFYLQKKSKNLSLYARYMTLFFALFCSTLLVGFLSRANGFWFVLTCLAIAVCLGVTYAVLHKKEQRNEVGMDTLEKPVLSEKWICLAGLVFLAAQLPACFYWLERLTEVSMPEPFIPLALSQYYTKNLVLVPAAASLIAGFLFLRRRRLE